MSVKTIINLQVSGRSKLVNSQRADLKFLKVNSGSLWARGFFCSWMYLFCQIEILCSLEMMFMYLILLCTSFHKINKLIYVEALFIFEISDKILRHQYLKFVKIQPSSLYWSKVNKVVTFLRLMFPMMWLKLVYICL